MAPSRPAPSLVVRTPRHASRRVRPALAAEIRRLAKHRDGADLDLDHKPVANDPTHPLGIASDNASEWNSLLITARAERGPQWDVATQRFMVDYGSHLYFDSGPLTVPEERTPPPEEVSAQATPPQEWQGQGDPRFAQYGGMQGVGTPARTSLRLQHQSPMNGHGNGHGPAMANPYPYAMTNGRTPEQHPHQQQQQQYAQVQQVQQVQQSYYDGSQSHGQGQQNHGHGHAQNHHAMTNGISIGSPGGAVGSPMLGRQMSMGQMGMEFAGGGGPETPSPDMRRRTRSQQDVNMEMGW